MTDRVAELNARDDLLELARTYETVAALDLSAASGVVGHVAPASRVPPGMQQLLDAEEIAEELKAVDRWAEFFAHVAVDELQVTMPDATSARLRAIAEHAGHFVGQDDERLAADFRHDVAHWLRRLKYLVDRDAKRIQTGVRCKHPTCKGSYISPLGSGGNRNDAALECDRCHDKVPYAVWSSWPKARVKYITAKHAARILHTTIGAVWVRAKRQKWRRIGTGRDVRYLVDDVQASASG
jgi:hypothetical protein